MQRRFGDCNVRPHIPQAETATSRADHQQPPSSVLINEEDEIDDSENGLDDTEQTSSEE
jgi:hypothetical protein